jgi:hypothetical protein
MNGRLCSELSGDKAVSRCLGRDRRVTEEMDDNKSKGEWERLAFIIPSLSDAH